MAIWQYSFDLISLNNFKNINLEEFEKKISNIFWKKFNKEESYIDFWEYESDRCTIYINNNKINNIYCRFDLRKFSKNKIDIFFDILSEYKLYIFINKEKIIWKQEFLDKIKNSKSIEFLKKPLIFLKNINKDSN